MSNTETERTKALRSIGPSSIVTVDNVPAEDVVSLKVYVDSVQSGSGEPSPTNVRPISGWTGAKVTRTGKNLYDANAIGTLYHNGVTATVNNGVITFNGTATANAYFTVRNTGLFSGKYVFSFNNPVASNSVRVSFRTTSGVYFSDASAYEVNKSVTIQNEPNAVILYVISGTTLTNFVVRPQLELGSTATDYEPYAGATFPIAFPSEAGTVYGGTLDVTKGTLTVDRTMVDMTSITDWVIDRDAKRIYKVLSCIKPSASGTTIPNILSNQFDTIALFDIFANKQGVTVSTGSALQFHIDGLTDNADVTCAQVNQWFIDNPTQVVYELAEPQTYQLTPTQIALLAGVNNVWADCGDILKMRYWSYDLLLNKVVYDNNTLIDLTGDTITPEVMLAGYTAHDATGSEIEGSIEIATIAEVRTYFGLS